MADYMERALYGAGRPLTAPSFRPTAGAPVTPTQGNIPKEDLAVAESASTQAPAAVGGTAAAPMAPPDVYQPPPADYTQPNDNLAMWGYTGEIPINNVEQQAIDFTNMLYGTGGGLETMGGAQDYYNRVLNGEFGPESAAYIQAVLDPMRSSMTSDYEDMSKGLAGRFSQFGGYYGGKSGVAQGRLASDTNRNMAQQEANLRYQGFNDNMGRMGDAAGGLVNLGGAQSDASGDMLNYLLSTGNMITGRDATNRAEYQNALGRSYQDWLRARQELLMPFSMSQSLLGQQATTPIVTQQQSPFGALLGGIGQVAGMVGGKALGFS